MIFISLIIISLIQALYARNVLDFLTKQKVRQYYENETLMMNKELTNPYCSLCCIDIQQRYKGRQCGVHTMCVYDSDHVGNTCQGLIVMEFTQNEIDAIVDAHNTLRNLVALGMEKSGNPGPQPSAANMKIMSWDPELAQVALRWAKQCVFAHDSCRDLERFPVGQNIALGTYASKSDLEHIADWYEAVQYSNKTFLRNFNRNEHELLGFYTQLIWADTYLVGCARVNFQKFTNGQGIYKEHFFCNYGPSGNIPHQSAYKFGEPCSACSEGTYCINPEYPGLCSNVVLNETYLESLKQIHQERKVAMGGSNELAPWFNSFIVVFSAIIWHL